MRAGPVDRESSRADRGTARRAAPRGTVTLGGPGGPPVPADRIRAAPPAENRRALNATRPPLSPFEWLRGALTAYCMESITLSTPNTSVHMEGSTVTITGGGAVLTIGPDRITSNVDIVAQGVSLVHHKHTGVTKGLDLTGAPT